MSILLRKQRQLLEGKSKALLSRGSDIGRTGGLAIARLLTELQGHAPVSLYPLYLFSFSFFCCVVLPLCLLPLLLSRLFGHCPTAKCQTYVTVRSPLPCGRTELRLFQASPLILRLERPSHANCLEKVKKKKAF